jgi:hypothetical protein
MESTDKMAQDSSTGRSGMTRMLLTIGAAVTFMVASTGAWAQGVNEGPKYPSMVSNKHYTDQRIMDHTNAAPRYAVTSNPNKHYTDQRIMDRNNAAPRYAVTAATSQGRQGVGQASRTGQRTRVVHTVPRRAPTTHANAALAHHG